LSAAGQARPAFPWDELARFAFTVLRLTPHAFWAASPRELALAMNAYGGGARPLERAALDHLIEQFPDLRSGHD
jgi:uncharacterized phage protein (TIGR02216 family)